METTFTQPPTILAVEPAVPPTWMDAQITNALQKKHLDFPVAAYQAMLLLEESEVIAFRQIANAKGEVFDDNRNMIEVARMAMLVATFQSDAGFSSRATTLGEAVNLIVHTVKTFVGLELATSDRILSWMAYQGLGLMYVYGQDRAAWGYTLRAVSALPEKVVPLGEVDKLTSTRGFRVIFEQAKQWIATGPWTSDCTMMLEEMASQVLVGNGLQEVPEYQAMATMVSTERLVADTTREMLRMLGSDEHIDPEMDALFARVDQRRTTANRRDH